MKRLLLIIPLALLLFCDLSVQAKVKTKTVDRRQQLIKSNAQLVRVIEKQQQARLNAMTAAKTTGTSERLIATSEYNISDSFFSVLGIIDSNSYTYSGYRSSSFDFNSLLYFPTYVLDGSEAIIPNASYDIFEHNGTPDVLFDTCQIWARYYPEMSFSHQGTSIADYDANNNLTQFYGPFTIDSNIVYDNARFINTYDADQHLTSSLILNWVYGVWDTSELRLLTYNGAMIAIDSTSKYVGNGQWAPEEKWSYTYNNVGNIIGATFYYDSTGAWFTSAKYFYSYYPDNTYQKDSISGYTNGIWLPLVTDSVGYTPGINYVTYDKSNSYDASSGALDSYTEFIKHITNGLPDTIYNNEYEYSSGQLVNGEKETFDYDNYNNPVLTNQYFYDVNNSTYNDTPDYVYYYYYQQYTTAVNNIVKQQVDIKAYPNPTTSQLNISQTGIQQGERTYITLINALGQTVHSESLPWMSNTETISVAGLVPGNYWLVIQDKGGNVLSRQAIVKE